MTNLEMLKADLVLITPGDWSTEDADNPCEFANVYGGDRPVLAMYIGDPNLEEPDEQDKANLRFVLGAHALIPLLLELVEAVDATIDSDGDLKTMDMGRVLNAMEKLK